jgi:hypothetical protein
MPLAVKVYLSLEGRSEIRRFELSDSQIGSYAQLHQKIVSTFPEMKPETIQLFWIDNEGDRIVFGSDDELKQAINKAMNDGILKIYVNGINSDTKLPGERFSHVTHFGVTCDGCEKPVTGIRFKCIQCADYDLCTICESKDIHKEHILSRIVDASQSSILYSMLEKMNRGGNCRRRKFNPLFENFQNMGFHCHRGGRHGKPKETKDTETDPSAEKKPCEFNMEGLFKNIADAMNVFGVDVDAEIDVDGKREKIFTSAKPSEEKPNSETKKTEESQFSTQSDSSKKSEDWCMVNDDVQTQSAVSNSIEDQRILEIVQKLESMGFVDDDKWLTNLVKEKKADMNAVLDSMHFKM